MITDPNKILEGKSTARWTGEILEALPDGTLEYYNGRSDYQGSGAVVVRFNDGKWFHYEWSYGSCSGCDPWEGEEERAKVEWLASAKRAMDADTFADYLAGCIAQNSESLGCGSGSYSYEPDDGKAAKALLAKVAAECVGREHDPMKNYPIGETP